MGRPSNSRSLVGPSDRQGRTPVARPERYGRREKPQIKMGVLLGRCPAGKQVLVTWALRVVPSGISHRGPDMSLDMRLLPDCDETAGSDICESMTMGFSVPLG